MYSTEGDDVQVVIPPADSCRQPTQINKDMRVGREGGRRKKEGEHSRESGETRQLVV